MLVLPVGLHLLSPNTNMSDCTYRYCLQFIVYNTIGEAMIQAFLKT
jgi:hypothetical protein